MAIQAMDGRQRGKLLRGNDGKFVTRTDWLNNVQTEINEYYKKNQVYRKYLDQNADLKVLIDDNQAKIDAKQKEIRLVNNSQRGINDRVKIYREAMEKQGLKGAQLEEQVARYRDGLLAERRKHFNKLKGKNFARLEGGKKFKVKPDVKQSGGFFSKIRNWAKSTKGKFALAAGAVALVATAIGVTQCNSTNTSGGVAQSKPKVDTDIPQNSEPKNTSGQAKPTNGIDETYVINKGDYLDKIAEQYLQKVKGEGNYTKQDIVDLRNKIAKDNTYIKDVNKIYPNEKLDIKI